MCYLFYNLNSSFANFVYSYILSFHKYHTFQTPKSFGRKHLPGRQRESLIHRVSLFTTVLLPSYQWQWQFCPLLTYLCLRSLNTYIHIPKYKHRDHIYIIMYIRSLWAGLEIFRSDCGGPTQRGPPTDQGPLHYRGPATFERKITCDDKWIYCMCLFVGTYLCWRLECK